MHALGFAHMQQHPDRNKYIEVFRENIKPEAWTTNFEPTKASEFGNFNTPYDFGSIMHQGPTAYSKTGPTQRLITMKSRVAGKTFGQSDGLSNDDIKRINRMYECKRQS